MLSREELDRFFEHGYVSLSGFYSADAVARLGAAFERLERRAWRLRQSGEIDGALFVIERAQDLPLRIQRVVWCGAAEPALRELGRTPQLLEATAQLLGMPIFDQLINQAHIKRPGDGVAFSFHQDSYHRRYGTELFDDTNGRGSFVQTLTAIDAMGPQNGGLWLVPRSHQAGHIATADGRLPDGSFDRAAAIPVHLEPGDTLLLHPFIIHGSEPNAGGSARRLFINGFCCPGANRRVYHGAGTGIRIHAFEPGGEPETALDRVV